MATYYVDPDVSGGDGTGSSWANAYSSLNAAEQDRDGNITGAGPTTFICGHNGSGNTTADTAAVSVSGWTTTSADYVSITSETANAATANGWSDSRYRLSVSNAVALTVSAQYVRVNGLQIENYDTATTAKSTVFESSIAAGGSYHLFSNLRIRSDAGSTLTQSCLECADPDAVYDVVNCVAYARSDNAGTVDGLYLNSSATAGSCRVINCTISNVRRGIRDVTGTKINVYNSAVFNCTDDFNGTFNLINYCAHDDATETNETNRVDISPSGTEATDWAATFEDYTNGDFRLKSGATNLIGAALDDPTGSGYGSPDINGTTRADWDIGADEYVAAGGFIPYPLSSRGARGGMIDASGGLQ